MVLGFVFAIVLVTQSVVLFGVVAALVFVGWALVRYGVFDDADDPESELEGPVETLQTWYARGEVDEVEFERRLDPILDANEAAVCDSDWIGATDAGPKLDRVETGEPERENV